MALLAELLPQGAEIVEARSHATDPGRPWCRNDLNNDNHYGIDLIVHDPRTNQRRVVRITECLSTLYIRSVDVPVDVPDVPMQTTDTRDDITKTKLEEEAEDVVVKGGEATTLEDGEAREEGGEEDVVQESPTKRRRMSGEPHPLSPPRFPSSPLKRFRDQVDQGEDGEEEAVVDTTSISTSPLKRRRSDGELGAFAALSLSVSQDKHRRADEEEKPEKKEKVLTETDSGSHSVSRAAFLSARTRPPPPSPSRPPAQTQVQRDAGSKRARQPPSDRISRTTRKTTATLPTPAMPSSHLKRLAPTPLQGYRSGVKKARVQMISSTRNARTALLERARQQAQAQRLQEVQQRQQRDRRLQNRGNSSSSNDNNNGSGSGNGK